MLPRRRDADPRRGLRELQGPPPRGEDGRALQKLPGIGAITKKHLARNIGLVDVAKDDVWLVRVATLLGASCVDSLVAHLARGTGDGPGAIDLVLWRFCTEAGWKDLGHTSLDEMVCGLCE